MGTTNTPEPHSGYGPDSWAPAGTESRHDRRRSRRPTRRYEWLHGLAETADPRATADEHRSGGEHAIGCHHRNLTWHADAALVERVHPARSGGVAVQIADIEEAV